MCNARGILMPNPGMFRGMLQLAARSGDRRRKQVIETDSQEIHRL